MVCKTEDVVGSRVLSRKVCLTAAQWHDKAFNRGQWAEHMTTYNGAPGGH